MVTMKGLEQPENQYTYRGLWSPHVKTLLEILFEEQSQDLCIEVSFHFIQ